MTATEAPVAATGTARMRRTGEVSRVVARPAAELYLRVSDVTRTPEWSPEVHRAEWLGGAVAAAPGVRFRGANRWRLTRWSRDCEVLVADRGREFSWRTLPEGRYADSTVWTYRFEPAPGGTLVTHSYELVEVLTSWQERVALALLPHHHDRRADMAGSLDRLAAAAEGRADAHQLELGQAHTAPGPLDLAAMWVMHHGFRRDLRDVALAVPATPVGDAATWQALHRYWTGVAEVLHHHHAVEDEHIWPPLLARVDAAGDAAGRATLEAMAAEHDLIDPALAAVDAGLRAMIEAPDAATRGRLAADLDATRILLERHLAHEESGALPLAQRHLSRQAWDDSAAAAAKEYGLAGMAFTLGWVVHGLPPAGVEAALGEGGTLARLLLRLLRPRFLRLHAAAFRHLPAGGAS